MSRYGGWRRLTGDTADRPDLLDLGKKLLGYLSEQRRLTGLKTCSIQRQAPDGSLVRARFDYDIPVIEVMAAPAPTGGGQRIELAGVVARPRTFADPFAFGDNADVLLALGENKAKGVFFDSYKAQFPDGLVLAGNLDWRNADETLAVTWIGPLNRYFPVEGRHGTRVHHNGKVIYDSIVDLGSYQADVVGAALRKAGGKHYLLVALFYFDAFKYEVRAIEVDSIRNPIITPVEGVSPEVLATVTVGQFSLYFYPTPLLFNQSGTEARTMLHRWDNSRDNTMVVSELVIDLRDLDAVTTSETHEADVSTAFATHVVTDALWNGPLNYAPLGGNMQSAVTPAVESYRCAVDFKNDAPVYATWYLPWSTDEALATHEYTVGRPEDPGSASTDYTRTQGEFAGRLTAGEWLNIASSSTTVQHVVSSSDGSISTRTHTVSGPRESMLLWWLDLRYDAAVVTTKESAGATVTQTDRTLVETGPGTTRVDTVVTTTTVDTSVFRTQVVFNGAPVDSIERTDETDTTTVVPSSSAGEMSRWEALQLPVNPFASFPYFGPTPTAYERFNFPWRQDIDDPDVWHESEPATTEPPNPDTSGVGGFPDLPDEGTQQFNLPAEEPPGGWHIPPFAAANRYDLNTMGSWLVTRTGWVFSMRWPGNDGFKWQSRISTEQPLDPLTGSNGAELYQPIWPLSAILTNVR